MIAILLRNEKMNAPIDTHARTLKLEEWGLLEFGDACPSVRTLRAYAKAKMMAPPAIKVGRSWVIDRDARFVGLLASYQLKPTANPRLRRIIEDGCKTESA